MRLCIVLYKCANFLTLFLYNKMLHGVVHFIMLDQGQEFVIQVCQILIGSELMF